MNFDNIYEHHSKTKHSSSSSSSSSRRAAAAEGGRTTFKPPRSAKNQPTFIPTQNFFCSHISTPRSFCHPDYVTLSTECFLLHSMCAGGCRCCFRRQPTIAIQMLYSWFDIHCWAGLYIAALTLWSSRLNASLYTLVALWLGCRCCFRRRSLPLWSRSRLSTQVSTGLHAALVGAIMVLNLSLNLALTRPPRRLSCNGKDKSGNWGTARSLLSLYGLSYDYLEAFLCITCMFSFSTTWLSELQTTWQTIRLNKKRCFYSLTLTKHKIQKKDKKIW